MSDVVRPLTLAAAGPDEAIVKGLRELLERAERGEVTAIAVAAQMTGREVSSLVIRGREGSIFELLGQVVELQYRICREDIEQS